MPDTSPPTHDTSHSPMQTETATQTTARAALPEGATLEIIHVDQPVVACDGGDGALGHPRVWLRIVAHDIVCPYCSRNYVLNDGIAPDPGH